VTAMDEIPKSPGVWHSYFERMFPLKKRRLQDIHRNANWT
jgi:hypothetical protein